MKNRISLFMVILVSLFWACKKDNKNTSNGIQKSTVTIGQISLSSSFQDYGAVNENNKNALLGLNSSNHNAIVSAGSSLPVSTWPHVYSGLAYVTYNSRTQGIAPVKDSVSVSNTAGYTRTLINDTYDITLVSKTTTHIADSFIRYSAQDTGYVINKSGPINFNAITTDGVLTIAISGVKPGTLPLFTVGTGTTAQKFNFGNSNGYYFLYIKNGTVGTLTMTVPSGQVLTRSITVAANNQYNVVVSQVNSVAPLTLTFAPFSLNTLDIGQGVGTVNVSTYAGNGLAGNTNGPALSSTFYTPNALTVDNTGNIFIADAGNNMIRKIDPSGNVTTLAGNGSQGSTDGPGLNASFYRPTGVVADNQGNVYVADQFNGKIRKIDVNGFVTTFSFNGTNYVFAVNPTNYVFYANLYSIALDNSGNLLWTSGSPNNLVYKFNFQTATLTGITGQYNTIPLGLAVDALNNIYFCVAQQIFRIDNTSGAVTVFAGTLAAGSQNGNLTNSTFNNPWGLAFDKSGNLYVAEFGNSKIRRIDIGGNVTTYAGSGATGSADGMASLATFNNPQSLGFDQSGNLYVADTQNNKIRKIVATK